MSTGMQNMSIEMQDNETSDERQVVIDSSAETQQETNDNDSDSSNLDSTAEEQQQENFTSEVSAETDNDTDGEFAETQQAIEESTKTQCDEQQHEKSAVSSENAEGQQELDVECESEPEDQTDSFEILPDSDTSTDSKENEMPTQFIDLSADVYNPISLFQACADYLDLAQSQGRRWQKMLQYEHEQRLRLEEMVEQLAKQHSSFEKQARKSLAAATHNNEQNKGLPGQDDEDEEDDFFDALDEQTEEFKVCLPPDKGHKRTGSGLSVDSLSVQLTSPDNWESSGDSDTDSKEAKVITKKKRGKDLREKHHKRSASQESMKTIPQQPVSTVVPMHNVVKRERRKIIPEKPNYSINLWSIMKNCIGKELTKIPMPVNFSEPLSMLQRLTEDFEYTECLDKGAMCEDSCEQLAYVAAFTISSYANTTSRTGKPFNPLLGETYECDRRSDFGWRSLAEQVSHHPPMVAMYTEGQQWKAWQEFTMSSKFRGKYLQIIPLGIAHLVFPKTGNHYTWRKVTTTVHNIIVGRLWVDNHGEMDISNHHNGDNCHLKYNAYSYFSGGTPRKVTGVVTDSTGAARWVLQGTWDDKIEGAKVLNTIETGKGKTVYETGATKILWQRRMPRPELEKCYNFTQFALELNEPEEGVAPTDARQRPDQRKMEEGDWDEANRLKVLIEEKQRSARRDREKEAAEAAAQGTDYVGWEPVWFKKDTDPTTGNLIHIFTGEYWECKDKQDWKKCPDIYL